MSESIFGKLKTAIVGATHDMLDSHEDVGVTARQTVRELETQIAAAEEAVAITMSEQNVRISHRDQAQADVQKYDYYAQQAIGKGNDELARSALTDKREAQIKLDKAQADIDKFQPLIDKQREGVASLQNKLKEMQDRVDDLETRSTIAAAQDRTATILGGIGNGESATKVFDRLEDKVLHQEGLAEAKTTMAGEKMHSSEDKYAGLQTSNHPSVDDELAAMKAAHAATASAA